MPLVLKGLEGLVSIGRGGGKGTDLVDVAMQSSHLYTFPVKKSRNKEFPEE
jgi:hypothetical protein